jgi:hypothetical protein
MSFSQRDYKGTDSLIIDSVIGYRQWFFVGNSLIGTMSVDWNTGNLRAECKNNSGEVEISHKAPHLGCTCGIYAHYLPLESYHSWSRRVFGVVEASGRILMGTKGFRAEKAKIVALAGLGGHNEWFEVVSTASEEDVQEVIDFATSIGVPYFPTVEKMVLEFPQKDLSSLGVSDLSEWQESIPKERERLRILKENYERQAEENRKRDQARMEFYRMMEADDPTELLKSQYGNVSQRMIDTYKHLGGYQ